PRSRSPTAMGTRQCCLIRLKTSMFPGSATSSSHITLYDSIALANWIMIGGGSWQWQSNITLPSGPTCARARSTIETSFFTSFSSPEYGYGPAGGDFTALGVV